ncbi:hypothetical protein L218DRAFT_410550 [Marasmius fiardii PR-910]|nr:hypothetical protein L218DRAFT_410550 [Marasmius fiardii PR-910]
MDLSNLLDYEAVGVAYESILREESSWFLLQYSDNSDRLFLRAQGDQDLSELKSQLTDLSQVYIAFYREQVKLNPGFVLINYIPTTVSGVRRARALVHSRRIGSALIKKEHATLTVDHISNITPASIRDAVLNPDSVHTIQINRSFYSIHADPIQDSPPNMARGPVRRSFTEVYAPSFTSPPEPVAKTNSMFSSLLRRKPKDRNRPSTADDATGPPPPPPKDRKSFGFRQSNRIGSAPTYISTDGPPSNVQHIPHRIPPPIPRRTSMTDLISEFAVISHDEAAGRPTSAQQDAPLFIIPLEKKWIPEATFIPDPDERARRRQLVQEQREREEQEAIKAEEERQRRLKREKEHLAEQERREEERRRASLDEELRRARAERRLKEEREKEEDLRKKQEIAARKEADRERRLEEHRKLEKWRQEQAQLAVESESKQSEARRLEEMRRKSVIQKMVSQVKQEVKSGHLQDGWVTLQSNDSVVWRRRYYKLIGSTLFFYRNDTEINTVLDEIDLQGKLAGVREWDEGFEELKAIPHSFALQFKDHRTPWAMFLDFPEEKDKLLGIIYFAAGLKV